jgi:hypothetical protein
MTTLKEIIILEEINERLINEKKYGMRSKNYETGLLYVSVNVWDLELTRNVEKEIWKMSEFYGIISNWCEIQSKCRITTLQFMV